MMRKSLLILGHAAGKGARRVLLIVTLLVAVPLLLALAIPTSTRVAEAQSFSNAAIADAGLREVGTSRPTGWNQQGECVVSVRRWVAAAGGSLGYGGPTSQYTSSGAAQISAGDATKGDIVQYTSIAYPDAWLNGVHTFVIVANHHNGLYDIVQSNVPTGSGLVTAPDNVRLAPPSGFVARIWRLGTVVSTPTPAAPAPSNGSSVLIWNGTVHQFGRGATGQLWHKWYVNGLGWEPSPFGPGEVLGAGLASDPEAIVVGDGSLHVFATAADGRLWHQWYVNGVGWQPTLSSAEELGAAYVGTPQPALIGGYLHVFMRGADNSLRHTWYVPGPGWQPSPSSDEALGSGVGGNPRVSQTASGATNVFARSVDGELWHKWYVPGAGWEPSPAGPAELLGGSIASDPLPLTLPDGSLHIYATSSAGTLWHKWLVAGLGWQPTAYGSGEDLSGDYTGAPQPLLWGGSMHLLMHGRDGALRHKWYVPGWGWQPSGSADESLGMGITGTPQLLTTSDGSLHVFDRATDGELWHKWYVQGLGWEPSPYGPGEFLGGTLDPRAFL